MTNRVPLYMIKVLSLSATIALVSSFSIQTNEIETVCETPACYDAAARTLEKMDLTVSPCDDFYNFACGNFKKYTKLPLDKEKVDTFSAINDKVREQLRSLISESNGPNDPALFNAVKKIYSICMDESSTAKSGMAPLHDILDHLGGWPVLKGQQWNQNSDWSWTGAIKQFREIGFATNQIITTIVSTDLKNSTSRKIHISPAKLGLDREYLMKGLDDKVVMAYYKYMVDIAVMLGANRTQAEKEMRESLDFEMKLANISISKEDLKYFSIVYNPLTLRVMQQKYPVIQWVDYINVLLPSPLTVDENEVVIVLKPSYFENLDKLLKETPPRVVANHMMWMVSSFSTYFLTNDFRDRELEYTTVITGVQANQPKWKECISMAKNLKSAVSSMYIRKYFREDSKAAALDMENRIRDEFEIILRQVDWMDEKTRQTALNKLRAISSDIGYADELMDNIKLEKLYEKLIIDETNYLTSILSINIFNTDRTFGQLRTPVNKRDWVTRMAPFSVNAYYAPGENGIQFPAAIMQQHFFSVDRPRYMNYGSIGVVIGHEITHGFDNQGKQFDLNGNLVNWWDSKTSSNFVKRAKCIIEQYGNYTEPFTGLKLNGVISQGENIADNGGLKEAYLAYQKWENENGVEPRLPGLNYTSQQMFWISSAQNWCSVFRLETLVRQIIADPHPPSRFRVIGPFSNRKEFASDFQCPSGSTMNPVKKCEVW